MNDSDGQQTEIIRPQHLFQQGHPKKGGRKKGTPNKTTALLKDAILQAAMEAGGKDGLVGYLRVQALTNPGPFMALLGKVLPMQLADNKGDDFPFTHIEQVIIHGRVRPDGETVHLEHAADGFADRHVLRQVPPGTHHPNGRHGLTTN